MDTNNMPRILMADDNHEIREVVNILLSGEGYRVDEAADGREALEKIRSNPYDLVILDVMMPNMNGYQACMEIRKSSNTPILFLSAKSQVEDKTLGFSSGGDDYLPKPFSYQELLSRVKALIRRYQVYKGKDEATGEHGADASPQQEMPGEGNGQGSSGIVPSADGRGTGFGQYQRGREEPEKAILLPGIQIYENQGRVLLEGEEVELTDIEFSILCLLGKHRGQIFPIQHLYECIWEEEYYYGASNTVMVHIRNLRGKIEKDPHNPKIIKNVWGKGYRCE